jgi:hypothetical protein
MECGGKRSATPLSLWHKGGVALPFAAALHNFDTGVQLD